MGSPRTSDGQWWNHRRFGLLVHASTASVPAWAPIGQYAEWYRAHLEGEVPDTLLHPSPMVETIAHHRDRWAHVAHFDDFLPLLTFDAFDADEWARLAVDAGMSYSVMVAKHHDGLCWWDAPNSNHTVITHGPRRNVLAEYAAACERADVAFGTYYSLLDWNDRRYPSCDYVDGVVHPHVLDLVERYGSRMLWGDGHWGGGGSHWRSDELIAAARSIDPTVIVNDRWWSDGPGVKSFEYRLPAERHSEPWEMRRGLGGSFAYNRAERVEHLLSPSAVVALLTEVVAKGGHLLLSVGPDATGRIPSTHADTLRAAGTWVQRHRRLVDHGRPWSTWGDTATRYIDVDGVLHAVDVGGVGTFRQLTRTKGEVRGIERVEPDGVAWMEFEQTSDGLRLTSRHSRRTSRDPLEIAVYRITFEPAVAPPIVLFAVAPQASIPLADVLAETAPGSIVQLGDGIYSGPARVPDGVVLRGLGPGRTVIECDDGPALALGRDARVEHCLVRSGSTRIVWLPNVVVALDQPGATVLGCTIEGHVAVTASRCRLTSCALIGVVVTDVDRLTVSRSTFSGMNWDCAAEITRGSGHLVESCDFREVLAGIRLDHTVGAVVRGNRLRARWWGVRAIDCEATVIAGNTIGSTTRAIDIDGGTQTEVTGNAVADGDSGCLVQRGASETVVTGNRWERCRVGLLAWDAGSFRQHDNAAVDLGDPDGQLVVGP